MAKKKAKILISLFLIIFLITSYCYATIEPRTVDEAQTISSEEGAIPTSEGEQTTQEEPNASWTNSDLFVSQDKVDISNTVDGNAFVIGKEVTISGEIGGDLFVFADKLNIEGGYIYSSIFACANEIKINGVVYDLYAVCRTLNLESNGFIYRDMKLTAENVKLSGKIRRDAYIGADYIAFGENVGNVVYGNLHYSSKDEMPIPEDAVVGEVEYSKTNETNAETIGSKILSKVLDLIRTLVLTLVITLALVWLSPKFIERVSKMDVAKSFISLGIGFLTPIVLIIASILLMISSIGVSVFLFGIFAFVTLAFLGFSVTSIFFSKLLVKQLKLEGNIKFVAITLAIAAILWLICQIPILGGFISIIISIFGIGTTLVNIVWKKEKSKEETIKE